MGKIINMKTIPLELTADEASLLNGIVKVEVMKLQNEQEYWRKTVQPPMPHIAESLQPRLDDVSALGVRIDKMFKR